MYELNILPCSSCLMTGTLKCQPQGRNHPAQTGRDSLEWWWLSSVLSIVKAILHLPLLLLISQSAESLFSEEMIASSQSYETFFFLLCNLSPGSKCYGRVCNYHACPLSLLSRCQWPLQILVMITYDLDSGYGEICAALQGTILWIMLVGFFEWSPSLQMSGQRWMSSRYHCSFHLAINQC